MNIKDYATTSKIPLKTLRAVVRKGFVPETLTDLDLYALKLVENLWLWRDFLRSQMVKLNVKDRKALIETCKFNTKWERYAYTRMMNLKPEQELPMKKLFYEIAMTFRFKLSPQQEKILYKLRKSVQNKKQYVAREEKKNWASQLDWAPDKGSENDS
ncbi:MAG: hypothetical protein PHZ02_09935 [Desulfocapsaceae bacterium]|nr:hypothetical protein [Desulfocapsaceae bacterium]